MKINSPFILIGVFILITLQGCGGGGGGPATGDGVTGDTTGNGSNDNERPTVTGAISISNTAALISFSEAMGDSALESGNYSIVLENVNTEAGGLAVINAILSEDKKSVTLTTGSQGSFTYRVAVVNVRDVSGNVMQQQQAGVGTVIDPASALFAGTPPTDISIKLEMLDDAFVRWQDINKNGVLDGGDGITDAQNNTILVKDDNADGIIDNWQDVDEDGQVSTGDIIAGILDSDLDGLQDSIENAGWQVTITFADGSTTSREVTSDSTLADTDGDGLNDFEEYANNADPRNADSDGDSLSDFDEWNVIFSSLVSRDSDGDGLPDFDEYQFYFTSPILSDTDGDDIDDALELDKNRNPRIADRPKFAVNVKNVNLVLEEDFTFEDQSGTEKTLSSTSTATLSKDESTSTTITDAGVNESTGMVEASLETGLDATQDSFNKLTDYPPLKAIATVGGGRSWTDANSWQTDKTSVRSAQETYEDSLTKGESVTSSKSSTRNITGGIISLTVDVLNKGDFTLTFSDIQISVLKSTINGLIPITTLSMGAGFNQVEISPLNDGNIGKNIIFSNEDVPANVVEDLMKNVPALVFQVVNFSVVDVDGNSFASSDEDVFNKTAGIVFDYGDNANAERFLVSVAGSNDVDGYLGGGWQGGQNSEGQPRGISLSYALQDILGMTRHYRYDTIEAGADGVLDTVVDGSSDDIVDGNKILPGENGWLETQATESDVLNSVIHDHKGQLTLAEQGIIAGPDRKSTSVALGDDVQEVPPNTEGLPYGTVVVSAGDNKILDSVAAKRDLIEYVGGFETSRSCLGNASTIGAICSVNSDCNTEKESEGVCNGPERIARINTLRSGDFNRDWFVFKSDDSPTAANFDDVVIRNGQVFRLAFLQDLDRDGLVARTEIIHGSTDSSLNVLDNTKFGANFDFDTELANGEGEDVFADSKDSDYDGLSDFAEIKIGWKVNVGNELVQVFPHPGLADSDGDGLKDIIEMDLRLYCETDGSEKRTDALCSYLTDEPTKKNKAQAIIAGRNGVADTSLSNDDEALYSVGEGGLLYGDATILPGENGVIDSILGGDDEYIDGSNNVPSTHPRLADTDNDLISDFDELEGFNSGAAIIDGGNGIADSSALGDDIQLVTKSSEMKPNSVLISSGLDGVLDSDPGTGTLEDDIIRPSKFVVTDPLRDDTDGDSILDGIENLVGGDPTVKDSPDFADTDNDGLTDFVEQQGWKITINGKEYLVKSDATKADSDGDGLPDLVEKDIGSSPVDDALQGLNGLDSDGDGLTDYVEFNDFDKYAGFSALFSGFELLNDTDIAHTTSLPFKADSDDDKLLDKEEVDEMTNPLLSDTDSDGLTDYEEVKETWIVNVDGSPTSVSSDPLVDDMDGDDLIDLWERVNGTNPEEADTDGDTVNDLDELILGTKPTNSTDMCVKVNFGSVRVDLASGGSGFFTNSSKVTLDANDTVLGNLGRYFDQNITGVGFTSGTPKHYNHEAFVLLNATRSVTLHGRVLKFDKTVGLDAPDYPDKSKRLMSTDFSSDLTASLGLSSFVEIGSGDFSLAITAGAVRINHDALQAIIQTTNPIFQGFKYPVLNPEATFCRESL